METDLLSATVIGPSSETCDILSTTCLLLGSEKAMELIGSALFPIAVFIFVYGDEFKAGVDRVFITTDDGSYGEKGFTTDKLKELIEAGNEYDEIVAVGPPMMMKFTCKIAEDYGIHSIASLTAYMIDGTGMCGGCRCKIGGEDKFVCVDGPEFDGSLVDWDDLIKRSNYYKDQEAEDRAHVCRLTGGVRYHD